jgi:hypothetical protein
MTKKYLLLLGLLLILPALGCRFLSPSPQAPAPVDSGAPTQNPIPTRPGPTPVPLQGRELAVDQRMLQSASFWDTLVAEATVTTQGSVQHVQVWIDQPGRFKLVVTSEGGQPLLTVSDGIKIRQPTGELYDAPPDLLAPFIPPPGPSDTVTLHPLGMSLGYPLIGDVLFPVGLAQRSGHFQVTGQDTIAGRSATIIDWSYVAGTVNDRLWVDNLTGIVLRQQTFGKSGSNTPETEVIIQMIQLDVPVEDKIFDLQQTAGES